MLWTSSETFFARCDLVVQEFARRGYRVYNKADTRVVGYYSGFTPIKVPAVTFYFVREDLMA